MHCNVME